MTTTLDDLLSLTPDQLAAALALLDTDQLIKLAQPRSMTKVKTRKQAVRVITDEQALVATFATAGVH